MRECSSLDEAMGCESIPGSVGKAMQMITEFDAYRPCAFCSAHHSLYH